MQALIDSLAHHPALTIAAVFAAALLESLPLIGTVVPGSSFVLVAGILVGLGAVSPAWAAAAAASGAILGDGLSYYSGRRYRDQLRNVWPISTHPALIQRGQAFFRQHGGKSVFMARFLGPVRAVVPMVAGMSHMPSARFMVVNVLSAITWTAAHLLPGMVFGASLQLVGAVSSRLAILLVGAMAVVWLCVAVLRLMLSGARPLLKAWREHAVVWAHTRVGLRSRLILSLLDPSRPESRGLLTAAILLLGSGWIFLSILEDVVTNDALVRVDQVVFASLQQLRTPWIDGLMIVATELGGARVALPVIAVVALGLALKRCWRTLGYWLSAVAFAQALVWTLKSTLGRARPVAMYSAVDSFSFPSGHAASSIVLYGLLAVLIARGRRPSVKWAAALTATLLIGIVSFSRLYLGAHWMSDVLGSLTLGMAWVALLSMAYLQHVRNEQVPAMALAGVALGTLLLAGWAAVTTQYPADLVRYAPQKIAAPELLADWQATGWRLLPARRTEVDSDREEPFTVQWAGATDHIAALLQTQGWRQPPRWTLQTTTSWLLPSTPIDQLPVLEKFHRGAPATLSFEKVLGPSQRLVLRLWPSGHAVDVGGMTPTPLWMGMATVEHLRHPAHAFTLVSTDPDFSAALARFMASLKEQGLSIELVHTDVGAIALVD